MQESSPLAGRCGGEECSRRGLGRPIAGGADGSLLNGEERSRPPSVGVRCLLIIIIREVRES